MRFPKSGNTIQKMKKAIIHGDVYLESSVIQNGVVLIEDKKISAVGDNSLLEQNGSIEIIDASNLCVIPGYIDTHVHGGSNYDCNDGTEEAVIRMTEFYRGHGVTAYYPSTSSDPLDKIEKGFTAIRNVMQADNIGVEILGTHMEGPFINKKHKGCQVEEQILPLTDKNFKYVERNSDIIKRITLAPEIPENFNRIRELSEMGIVVSIGHSDAVYAEVLQACHQGATMVTHLYNSMSSITKNGPYRVSGVLEAALTIEGLYTELIADRKHLPDELMRLAIKCKGVDRILICSDANRGAGLSRGGTIFTCGQEAIIEDGVAMVPDRSAFASSITPIDQMVRNLINYVGVSRLDAVRMASTTPARMMRVNNRKGSIAPGKDADILLVDNDFNVKTTICRGMAYQVAGGRTK